MIAIILSPISAKARADFRVDFDECYKKYFIFSSDTQTNGSLSQDKCKEIVYTFIDFTAENTPLIGDCNLLPYPKSIILYALGEMLNHYERAKDLTGDVDLKNSYENIIANMNYLFNMLIYQWQEIAPEDKHAVAALNQLSSFPTWGLPLKEKYLNTDRSADEALDATLNRMKRRAAEDDVDDK